MDGVICAIKDGYRDLARDLSLYVRGVWFGLADYQHHEGVDTSGEQGDFSGDCHDYELDLRLTPSHEELERELGELTTCGGAEPALLALEEVVMGNGHDLNPPGPGTEDIYSGLDAGFRPNAVKFVVHSTDEEIQHFVDTPTEAEVIADMNGLAGGPSGEVEHIGLSIGDLGTATPGLQVISRGTNTVAVRQGVDCDDDGDTDIQEGEPLVCETKSNVQTIIPALMDIFRSLSLKGDIAARIEHGAEVVADVTGADALSATLQGLDFGTVDFHDNQIFNFAVRYECGASDTGKHFDVDLSGVSDGVPFDKAVTTIYCDPLVVPPPAKPPVGLAPFSLSLTPPLLNPVSQTNPNLNPQPRVEQQAQQQVQQQTQAQAQAVAVAQRQEQPQVAFVHAARVLKEQTAGQHAMSRMVHNRVDPLSGAKFGLAIGGLSIMLLYGLASVTVRRAFVRSHPRRLSR